MVKYVWDPMDALLLAAIGRFCQRAALREKPFMKNMKTLVAICLSLSAWSASAQFGTNTVDHGTNSNTGTNHSRIIAGPFTNAASGHFYYLLAATTWSNSEARAVAYGGHLVTINDADENQWVVDTFAHYGGVIRPLWIGLTDRAHEGVFEWVSGEPVTYLNWNTLSGEPNNSGGSGYEEDFTYIIQENSGNPTVLATFWNDVPNDGYGVIPPIYGVMETDVPINPPPPVVPPPLAHVQVACVEVCFSSMTNAQYQVQYKAVNVDTNWFNLGEPVIGTGAQICVTDTPNGSNRVYRIAVLP
jgi:hypothetical protein